MNRRQALQIIAAAPAALTASVSRAASTGVTFYKHGEHEQMARQLWRNAEAYYASRRTASDAGSMVWPQAFQMDLMENVCVAFCQKLLDPRGTSIESVYFSDEDPAVIRAQVAFGVMSGPEAIINGQLRKAMTRKTRLRGCPSESDLNGCCMGVPERLTAVELASEEVALETVREIRSDWKGGMRTNAYALALPPFIPPVILSPEWTFCRGWMIRYAKAAP